MWSDVDDEIIGGDLTAALAYLTPAGGAVVTPVAPVGLRDRAGGHGPVHDLARLRAQARPHRRRSARGARLPRARARLRDRAALRPGAGERQLRPPSRPRAAGARGRARVGTLHGPAPARRLLGPLAERLLRRPRAGDRARGARRVVAGPRVRRRAERRRATARRARPERRRRPSAARGRAWTCAARRSERAGCPTCSRPGAARTGIRRSRR